MADLTILKPDFEGDDGIVKILNKIKQFKDVGNIEPIFNNGSNNGWNLLDVYYLCNFIKALEEDNNRKTVAGLLGLIQEPPPSLEKLLQECAPLVEQGWLGEDLNMLLSSVTEDAQKVIPNIRSNRYKREQEIIAVLWGNQAKGDTSKAVEFFKDPAKVREIAAKIGYPYKEKDGPAICYNFGVNEERIKYTQRMHPLLNKFCKELGAISGIEAHKFLMKAIEKAFEHEVVYGYSTKVGEEVRVYVGDIRSEFSDKTRARGIVKLLNDEEIFKREVNEYWYRARLNLVDPKNFATAEIKDRQGNIKYYAIVMGHLGDLNEANYLNIIRGVDMVDSKMKEELMQMRDGIIRPTIEMIGRSHALAEKLNQKELDENYFSGRIVNEFLKKIEELFKKAKQNSCLNINYETQFEEAKKLVSENFAPLATFLANMPTLYYYDCVSKNFALEVLPTGQTAKMPTVILPDISRVTGLGERSVSFSRIIQENGGKKSEYKIHEINNVDYCTIRNHPGLFDVANYVLTTFYKRAGGHEIEGIEKLLKELVWGYITAYDEGVKEYNKIVESRDKSPREFLINQIQVDINQRFMFFINPDMDREELIRVAKLTQLRLEEEAEEGKNLDVYIDKITNCISMITADDGRKAKAIQDYFTILGKFIRNLEKKENNYLINKGYNAIIPENDMRRLEGNLDKNKNLKSVSQRISQIMADLYVSMAFRAAMIANTVPFYTRQNGDLNNERISYLRVETGNVVQALRSLRENYLQSDDANCLRAPLPLEQITKVEMGFEILYDITGNLKNGKIKEWVK